MSWWKTPEEVSPVKLKMKSEKLPPESRGGYRSDMVRIRSIKADLKKPTN